MTVRSSQAASGRAAVLGHPIGHSKSPVLHGAAYEYLGLEIGYTRIDLEQSHVGEFLTARGQEEGWLGWSVTMPLKAALVPHMSVTSKRVKTLGALNTVVRQPSGALHGENTDVDGIVEALREAGLQEPELDGSAGQRTLGILGGGATAAAALAAAAELGFPETVVYARSPERAASLQPVAEALGLTVSFRTFTHFAEDLPGLAAVVSTLPPRAGDSLTEALSPYIAQTPDSASALNGIPLLDVAYDPWPSQLARSWEQAGGAVVSGLVMLLHQAVKQVELFTACTEHPAGEQDAEGRAAMVHQMRTAVGL